MKKLKVLLLIVFTSILLIGCEEKVNNNIKATIEVENYGTIEVELYKDYAPITVDNFVKLVEANHYDGTKFHRIISGFMIQGGQGAREGLVPITGEFRSNGIVNNLKHTRGVISMARANDPNSATDQFFIVHKDSPHLDGNYAGFGKVTKGIEIVDKICEDTPVIDNDGTVPAEYQPVIKSIRIVK